MTAVSCSQLRTADPGRWQDTAHTWRAWASAAGRWVAELRAHVARLRTVWTGAAADAATAHLMTLIRGLTVFRLSCWAADQALSEFAAALTRARSLAETALGTALALATHADATAAGQLAELTATDSTPPTADPPACTAPPAEVRRWWDALSPAQRRWLLATEPGGIGPRDGVPAAARDLANRLVLDGLPPERAGLQELKDRLTDDAGPRAYLMRLDLDGEGRAVVALGDPDRAGNVLTQVPGMTADLASYGAELNRAQRIAVRAAELAPAASTSAIMWLGYDAPNFLDEAAGRTRADAGAAGLRRFQDGLRATHLGTPAHQTVLGHSYGSLVVGSAAAQPGLAADSLILVGSPGVGVDSASELHVPDGQVWASTSRSDVIQWAAVSPRSVGEDLLLSQAVPGGALLAFTRPEDDLFFGTNPSDPAFGARVFASSPDAGHLGYWDTGSAALEALTSIALGRGDVIPR